MGSIKARTVFAIIVSGSPIFLKQLGHPDLRRRRTNLNLIDRRMLAMVGRVDQSLSYIDFAEVKLGAAACP